MVCRWYQLHKVSLYHICILTPKSTLKVCINNALSCHFIFYIVIHKLRVVLGTNARKCLSLSLGYTKFFKGILYVLELLFFRFFLLFFPF